MSSDLNNLIRLTKADIKPAAEVLARAFQDHPLFSYLMPDETQRKKKQLLVFRSTMQQGMKYGEAYATSPQLEGVAVWFTAAPQREKWWRNIMHRLISILFIPFLAVIFGREAMRRQRAYSRYAAGVRARCISGRYWYLQTLAVDPEYQGKGYASRLLKPMLARADREGMPCFLETQEEKNVALYEHFGFKVMEEGIIPGSDIKFWAMLRKNE
jgi:GNAT superfamily N-acetyltransferase